MRYAALPPAFMRGVVRVAHTGTGGSPSYAYLSQKRAKKNSKHRKIILFDALLPGIRTPPVPALAQGHPPHQCGGRGRLRRQPCKFQFVSFLRETDMYIFIMSRGAGSSRVFPVRPAGAGSFLIIARRQKKATVKDGGPGRFLTLPVRSLLPLSGKPAAERR